jgi:anaerobic magnesium-protoporphyrin IX monomethyl ester cyclase
MLTRGKVILFYPPYDGPPLGAPLCLLALASTLRQANFDVVMIDAAIDPDYRTRIECESVDALCLGISVLTGPMIRGAVEVATAIKSDHPWLPIIFGGWHPTLLPDETLSEPFVDVVVRGQGEVTMVEVAEALLRNGPWMGLPEFRGRAMAARNTTWIATWSLWMRFRFQPLTLTDFDAYEKLSGARKIGYATSVGCPYACNYCTDMVFYKRRFNALSAERVVSEMTELVTRYRIQEVACSIQTFPSIWPGRSTLPAAYWHPASSFAGRSRPPQTFYAA